jgi:hypothetical protein
MVRADMVESSEFPHLVSRHAVMAVPKTVVNEQVSVEGALPEPQLLEAVIQAVQ